jgi:hypothetical protein
MPISSILRIALPIHSPFCMKFFALTLPQHKDSIKVRSKKEEKFMSRLQLPIFVTIASALVFAPVVASAQTSNQDSPIASALVAELNRPATSSSSIDSTDSAAAAVMNGQAPAPKPYQGGARPFSGVGTAVKIGIAGIGFDVATPLVQRSLNLRGGASFLSYTPSTITTDNLNIDGNIKFRNAGVMVDYFPFHGRFRLSGGATIYNNTGLTARLSVPTGQSFTVGGTDYYSEPYNAVTNPAGPITGNGTFSFGGNKVAPRVTIGTGNMLSKKGRFTFQSEIGFQYFSSPTVVYNITGTGCQNYTAGVYSNCGPIPQSNITDEQNKLQNDLTDLRFFPIVSFGLGFRIH